MLAEVSFVLLLVLILVIVYPGLSAPRSPQHADRPDPLGRMTPDGLVPVPTPDVAGGSEAPRRSPGASAVLVEGPTSRITSSPSPTRTRPVATPKPRPAATPRPRTSRSVSGTATWLCGKRCTIGYPPGSMVAAAGSELQVGNWRGRWVTVTSGGNAVRVRLVDSCLCRGNRIIDLYVAAFSRLAPTSRGVIPVRVSW